MDPLYLRPGFDFALAHAIEEAGEFLAAAGKTQRWGRASVNPELPSERQETNEAWLRRELVDLRGALDRLDGAVEASDAPSDDARLVARIAALEAENLRLSNAVVGRYLPGLLEPDETKALVEFIRSLRKDAAAFRASTIDGEASHGTGTGARA